MPKPQQPGPSRKPVSKARQRYLDELKRQVLAGEYETPERLDRTILRLLADPRLLADLRAAATREDDSGGARP